MKNIRLISETLSPENRIKFDGVLTNHDAALLNFKKLKSKYSSIKSNIKRIEKKIVIMMDELPEQNNSNWVMNEIRSIENKYECIDKWIKRYKEHEDSFIRTIKSDALSRMDNFNDTIMRLNNCSAYSNSDIAQANDCIRITKRYFKNITTAFKYHSMTLLHNRNRERMKSQQQIPPDTQSL
jgi:hypothetical protein